MCGILACFNKKKEVNQDAIDLYEEQFNRGQRGFGIIFVENNQPIQIKRATEPTKFLLDLYMNPSHGIMAHHRTPTSTENELQQTHPIKVHNKILKFDYYVVHNGMIHNVSDMVEKHEKLGFKYTTETAGKYLQSSKAYNDSEALAIEIALFLEQKIKTIEAEGSCAFCILKVDKKTQQAVSFYFGKDEISPLNYYVDDNYVMASSEGPGTALPDKTLFEVSLNTPKFKEKQLKVTFKEKPIIATPTRIGFNTELSHHPLSPTYVPYAGKTNWDDWNDYPSGQLLNQSKLPKDKSWINNLTLGDKNDFKEICKCLKQETIADLDLLIADLRNLDVDWIEADNEIEYYVSAHKKRLEEAIKETVDIYTAMVQKDYAKTRQESLSV